MQEVLNAEPHVLNQWIASEELDPVFDPEVLYEILKLGFAGMCQAWGLEVEPDDFDPRRHGEDKPQATPTVSPNQSAAFFQAAIGSR